MGHVIYLVAPSDQRVVVDEIGARFQASDAVEDIGIVVETDADRAVLETESEVAYDRIDVAPDLSPDWMRARNRSDLPEEAPSIDTLRERYGRPFLTPYVVADARYDAASRRDWVTLVRTAFGFFEKIINEYEPSVLLAPDVNRPFEWVPAQVAATTGTYYWWKTTRVGNRHGLIEGSPYENFCGFEAYDRVIAGEYDPTEKAREQAKAYVNQVRRSAAKPEFFARRKKSYGSGWTTLVFPHGAPGAREGIGMLWDRFAGADRGLDDKRLPRATNISRRLRTRISDPFERPRPDEPFVFFPLHAQPEPSTRILAPAFEDQLTLARQAARSLPVDHYLYVKDHPRMWRDNTRSHRYYKELASIPGVRVLDPNADSHTLIDESHAVLSVVGTPAMEAAFYETPSVVFGPAHFTALPSVRHCLSVSDLPEILFWALTDRTYERSALVDYLAVVFEHSFPIDAAGSSDAAQRSVAEAVAPQVLAALRSD